MIAHLIRWSARNIVLVLIGAALAAAAGVYAVRHVPLDAIPDLSDTQVIVYTEYSGQAPQVIEDQVTYPLSTAMLSVPKAKVVRGFSYFGASFVYVIFDDGTDIYWARSRVLEYLSRRPRSLPDGRHADARARTRPASAGSTSTSSWRARSTLGGVAHVAGLASPLRRCESGRCGRGRQRRRLRQAISDRRRSAAACKASTSRSTQVRDAIRGRNMRRRRAGGGTRRDRVHGARTRLPARLADIEQIVAEGEQRHAGAAARRGPRGAWRRTSAAASPSSTAKAKSSSGIAVQRYGANALTVIDSIKERLAEIAAASRGHGDRAGLRPLGTDPAGDRDAEIDAGRREPDRCAGLHRLPAARAQRAGRDPDAAGRHPDRVLLHARLGLGSNIMSLGGIAIAIGAMVDAAIVMIENAHKHLERAPPGKPRIRRS